MLSPALRSRLHRVARTAAALAVGIGAATIGGCSKGDEGQTSGTTTTPTTIEPVATTEVPAEAGEQVLQYLPEVGDCFDRRRTTDGQSRAYVLLLDCDRPHSFEVFALVPIEGTDHPGDLALDELAKRQCPRAWTDYVGKPYELSELELSSYLPSRDEWDLTLQHHLGCLLRASDSDDRLEGSKRNSAI